VILKSPYDTHAWLLLGDLGILLFCFPGFCGVGCLVRALSSSGGYYIFNFISVARCALLKKPGTGTRSLHKKN
jgi:hypothetical protein